MTFTAKIETRVDGTVAELTEVVFSDRQNAIDYLWPFVKSRSVHRTYHVRIVRSDGVVLAAPGFGKSHYGS